MNHNLINSRIPEELSDLDDFLAERESKYDIKPEAEARIVWNAGNGFKKTEYSLVYLHGFRASRREGFPVHRKIAQKFGFNLFLARLEEHGLYTSAPLLHLTEEKLLDSARFALEIGRRIGKRVIIMGTSTGASLGLFLAAGGHAASNIEALVLYSPLIRFYGLREKLLVRAWFREMLTIWPGKSYIFHKHQNTEVENQIWYDSYALQGALSLGAFVQHHMNKNLFKKIRVPVFTGYYYKNLCRQDKVVSVSAIKRMKKQLSAPAQSVEFRNFAHAGTHVICNSFLSSGVAEVIMETSRFIKSIVSQGTTGT